MRGIMVPKPDTATHTHTHQINFDPSCWMRLGRSFRLWQAKALRASVRHHPQNLPETEVLAKSKGSRYPKALELPKYTSHTDALWPQKLGRGPANPQQQQTEAEEGPEAGIGWALASWKGGTANSLRPWHSDAPPSASQGPPEWRSCHPAPQATVFQLSHLHIPDVWLRGLS